MPHSGRLTNPLHLHGRSLSPDSAAGPAVLIPCLAATGRESSSLPRLFPPPVQSTRVAGQFDWLLSLSVRLPAEAESKRGSRRRNLGNQGSFRRQHHIHIRARSCWSKSQQTRAFTSPRPDLDLLASWTKLQAYPPPCDSPHTPLQSSITQLASQQRAAAVSYKYNYHTDSRLRLLAQSSSRTHRGPRPCVAARSR